jgi:hypothetical protein
MLDFLDYVTVVCASPSVLAGWKRVSEAPHRLPVRQLRQKFSRGFPEFGMARLRSNLD